MQILSKHRTELMGIAILWTMLYHAQIYIPKVLAPLLAIRSLGYVSVDIFFLLSGMGLSFSWKNNPHVKSFLQKRLSRIIPVFWFFIVLCLIKTAFEFSLPGVESAGAFFGLDFLIQGTLDHWFIPSIVICYLIFVILADPIRRYGPSLPLMTGSLVAIFASVFLVGSDFSHLLIFLIRIPAFLMGIYIGHLLAHKKASPLLSNSTVMAVLLLLALSAWCVMQIFSKASVNWRYGLWWYPTMVLAYPFCFFLAKVLEYETTQKIASTVFKPLGEYSLELYLTHAFIFSLAPFFPYKGSAFNIGRWPEYILYSAISIFLAPRISRFFQPPARKFNPPSTPDKSIFNDVKSS